MHAPVKQPFAMPGVVPAVQAGAGRAQMIVPVHRPGSTSTGVQVANGRGQSLVPSAGHARCE